MPTGIRNGWRSGDYLVMDDFTGMPEWRSKMAKTWDGFLVGVRGNEQEFGRHPQTFVRAKADPKPLVDVRLPDDAVTAYDAAIEWTGVTGGVAEHLFVYAIEEPDGGFEIVADGMTPASARASARHMVVT